MRPAIVLPFHDPKGILLDHIERIQPDLKVLFNRAFLSISPATTTCQGKRLETLAQDPFFALNANLPETLPGDHYLAAYYNAIAHCPPSQSLHLCDVDRIAFALQSNHREAFLQSIAWVNHQSHPILFQRSPSAWVSHPKPYREAESIAIQLGQLLYGRYYDFAWSYLVVSSKRLATIFPTLTRHDFGLLAEIVLALRTELGTQEVEWLAWEDPFILNRNPDELRAERESDLTETRKRLQWNAPIIRLLLDQI